MERTTHNYAISVQWVFRLFLFLAFFSTCCKNRQSFANGSLILKLLNFYFEGQLYVASINEGWYTVSLEIRFTCIIFGGDKGQITPPRPHPRKLHECT